MMGLFLLFDFLVALAWRVNTIFWRRSGSGWTFTLKVHVHAGLLRLNFGTVRGLAARTHTLTCETPVWNLGS